MQRDPFYCYFKVHLKVQRAESGSGRGLGYSLFCSSSGLRVSAEGRCGSGQNGSASKAGIPRNAVLKRTGHQEWEGLGSMACLLHSKTRFLSTPLCSLGTTQTGRGSWESLHSGCSLKQPFSNRYSSCFQHQRL